MTGYRNSLAATLRGLAVALLCAAAGVAQAQGVTGYQQGKGSGAVTGAAGTSGASGNSGVEKCAKPMGAVAVVEPQDYVTASLRGYGLGSPVGLIRMMIQQSNCFIVVERGIGMQNAMQERELAAAGEARAGANMGKGQMVTADFILTPQLVFAEHNAGGLGGALGGLLGGRNSTLGTVMGSLRFSEAQTSMLLTDARSSVQVAAAQGSTRKADLDLGAALFGSGAFGTASGYANTNEGKIIAAALLDNYNNIARAVKGDASLQRNVGTLQQEAASGGNAAAGPVYSEGDVVVPKIANVKLLASAADGARAVATLQRGEELVVVGAEQNGFLSVQGSAASGWVRKALVSRP